MTAPHSPHAGADHGHDEGHGHQHVMPVWMLIGVFVALLFLTFVTVAVVGIDLGPLNIWIAMGVATAKATLVALYFMHLRYDNKFNLLVFLSCFFFVTLFVGITMLDTAEYQPRIRERTETLQAIP